MLDLIDQIIDGLIVQPIVLIVLLTVPFLLIARSFRVFPTKRMLVVITVPAFACLFVASNPLIKWYVVLLDAVVLGLALVDWFTVIGARNLVARRTTQKIASLEKKHNVELTVDNRSQRTCICEIRDDLPSQFEAKPAKFITRLKAKSRGHYEYQFKPGERGLFFLNCVYVKVQSTLGLWNGFYPLPVESEINVYPDMKQISQYDLLARTNRLNLLGVRRTRRIGTDNEFERLRDYTQDDNFRHIDWRTTARRQKLTVKDFQSNQSQRIIFMVDCGRMMTGMSGDITMLDHALNAMLMLGYVALRQGDSVGLICFSDRIHNYTPPRSGVNHINRLLNASFDQRPEFVESRFDDAFLHLNRNCRKRSLVVLITNLIDEINANQMETYLAAMSGKHLPLGVLLRDQEVFEAVEEYQGQHASTNHRTSLLEAGAAAEILNWRHQVLNDLSRQGVLTLDVFPDQLTAKLVNQYLEIKARHLL